MVRGFVLVYRVGIRVEGVELVGEGGDLFEYFLVIFLR